MEKDMLKRRLLSKLALIKSDLANVNPEDFDREIESRVKRIKEDVEFLIKKLIPEVNQSTA